MNFFKAFYITGFTTVLVTVIAFFNNVIVTRYLGPAGRGEYAIIANLILILGLVFGEGLRRSNIIIVGRDSGKVGYTIRRTLLIVGVMFLIAYLVYIFNVLAYIPLFKVDNNLFYIGLFSTVGVIFWRSLQSIFLGIEDYKVFNLTQLNYTILLFIINAVAIYIFLSSIEWIIAAFLISGVLVSLAQLYLLKSKKDENLSSNQKNDDDSFIWRATLVSIGGFIFLKGDIFIVNYFLSNSSTGIYSITHVITDMFQKLPLVLGPIVLIRSAKKEISKEILNVARLSRVLIMLNITVIVFLLIFGHWIITTLFTGEFEMSYFLLYYIMPALVVFSSGHIVHAFFMGQGFPNVVIYLNFFFALLNILLNVLFIPIYGITAVAVVCSISYGLWSLSFIGYFCVKYKFKLTDMFLLKKDDISFLKRRIFA